MITVCEFDELRDIQEVEPGLAVDIQEALITGIIKDTATSLPYTKETEVGEVGNYLHDSIEIAMAAKKLGASMSSAAPTSTEVKSE